MYTDKVTIGIVGCGWIAENAHIPALLNNEKVNVKAVFDTNIERAQTISDRYSIEYAFGDFEDFLDCGFDGIIIASPNDTHVQYTLEALIRKIGVLCEKPVAWKSSEVKEIIRVSKEHNVVYVPGFVNRWRQDIQTMYHTIKEGKLGEIRFVDAGWLRKSGVPRPGTWFTNRECAGGGVLVDLGSHIIDICLMFLGDKKPVNYELKTSICNQNKVKQSGAAGWFSKNDASELEMNVEDTAIVKVLFEDDVTIHTKLSWLASIDSDCTYFKVVGTKGEMELKTLFGFSNERLWKEDILISTIEGVNDVIYLNMTENNSRNAFGEMLSYFCESLLSRKANYTNCYDAQKTVTLIENLYKREIRDESSVKRSLAEEMY